MTLPPPVYAPLRGTELRLARDLEWTRLSLTEDSPNFALTGADGPSTNVSPSVLPFMDLRSSLWLSRPQAMSSLASAATSLITGGLSVFDVRRGNRIRQKHSVRAYFRARGMKISWRVQF